jgi:TetR/AcrR family transcriptional regulator, cholesterol catabolism regulator
MDEELKQILAKVRELYMRYGIKSITMDDVAAQLGMSKKTLYKHVSDKDDLVGKIVDQEIEIQQNDTTCIFSKDLNAIEELLMVSKMVNHKLKQVNPATEFDLRKYYPNHFERLVKARRARMHQNVVANIIKGKSEGFYREDLNEDIIGKMQVSRIESMLENEVFSIDEFTSPKFFQEVFIYHIRGIANQKGIDFLENKLKDFNIDDLENF